jgi:hypothetical protein
MQTPTLPPQVKEEPSMSSRIYHIQHDDLCKSLLIEQALDRIWFLLPDARNVISRYQDLLFLQLGPLKPKLGGGGEAMGPLEEACLLVGSAITRQVIRGKSIGDEDIERYRTIFRAASRALSRSCFMEGAMDEISADWLETSVEAIIVICRLLHIEGYIPAS